MSAFESKKIFNLLILRRVYGFVQPYRFQFYLSLAFSVLLAALSPVRGLFIQYTVDKGLKNNVKSIPSWLNELFDSFSHHNIFTFIVLITVFQVILLLVETVIRFLFTYITSWLGQHVIKDLRVTVYKKIIHLPLSQFDNTPIGTLTTRTINDIESINDIFTDGLIPIVADMLTIILTLLTMFWIDWQLTLMSLIPFPILLLATWIFKESVNKSFIKVRNAIAALNAFVQEHLTGMFVVQAFAAEARELNRFKRINKEHRNANIKAIFAYSVFFPIVEVVLAISSGLLVWWVAFQKIDAGRLIAFILFLNQIFRPLRVIADKFNVIQMGIVSSERVFKVLDISDAESTAIQDAHNKPVAERPKGSITFHNVWFAYTQDNWVLKNINFTLPVGQSMAIVGSTGSGKTTIISLINRLYPYQKGNILLDNNKIEDYPINYLRNSIGVVLQDVFLFSGSIYENVTLRNPDISLQQVQETAELIGMHDFIMQLPENYHYNVMERGATLSSGQRQLLSFMRCFLYNPAVLILDEATSSVDTHSEALIQQAIDKLIVGRTSIIIAHRLSTIRKANRILVLDKGEIKESGSHDELLMQQGYYSKLYEMQFKQSPGTYL